MTYFLAALLHNTADGVILSPVTLEPITDTTLVPVEPIRQMVLGLVEVKLKELRTTAC